MKKYNSKKDTMNESESGKVYNYSFLPRDFKITTAQGFPKIDDGQMGGSQWTCFYIKANKIFSFDVFVGSPDKFLLQQLPKPKIFHNFKVQATNSSLCGIFCSIFFI